MKTIFKTIRGFVEANRQTGTTTALIKAVKETGGYLIVSQLDIATHIIKNNPEIRGHVLTLSEVDSDRWRGNKSAPLFFDTSAICELALCGLAPQPSDGYKPDGYKIADSDGYQAKHTEQFNIRLTADDMKEVDWINRYFYEGELTNSTLGRILIRKGVQWYKNLSR